MCVLRREKEAIKLYSHEKKGHYDYYRYYRRSAGNAREGAAGHEWLGGANRACWEQAIPSGGKSNFDWCCLEAGR